MACTKIHNGLIHDEMDIFNKQAQNRIKKKHLNEDTGHDFFKHLKACRCQLKEWKYGFIKKDRLEFNLK